MMGPILRGPNELVPIWVPLLGIIIGLAVPFVVTLFS